MTDPAEAEFEALIAAASIESHSPFKKYPGVPGENDYATEEGCKRQWRRDKAVRALEKAAPTLATVGLELARALREAGLVIETLTGSTTHPGTPALARWDALTAELARDGND